MTQYLIASPINTIFTEPNRFRSVFFGKIYIGEADTDPLNPSNQQQIYLVNEDETQIPVTQGVNIGPGGFAESSGSPATFVCDRPFSMVVLDKNGSEVWRIPKITTYFVGSEISSNDVVRPGGQTVEDALLGIGVSLDDYCVGDGIADDTAKMIEAAEKAKIDGLPLYGNKKYLITGQVSFFTNTDLSNCTIVYGTGGSLVIADDRSKVEREITLSEVDFNKSLLTEGVMNIKDAITNQAILSQFERSFCYVKSESVYIYRNNGGVWQPQTKECPTVLGKYGRLLYSLFFDFSTASGVTIRLYKQHPRTLTFKCPQIQINNLSKSLITCTRNNTVISGYNLNLSNNDFTVSGLYHGGIEIQDCFDVKIDGANSSGIGVTNTEPGVAPNVQYDVLISRAAKINANNVFQFSSWKGFDGNYFRDLVVSGSVLNSVTGHFACADITVMNSYMIDRTSSFGGGAHDSRIVFENVKFHQHDTTIISTRGDYGGLKGTLELLNCHCDFTGTRPASGTIIFGMNDLAVFGSGTQQPQNEIYYQPDLICDGLVIECDGDVDFVKTNDGSYAATEKMILSKRMEFSNVTIKKCNVPRISLSTIGYDYAAAGYTTVVVNGVQTLDREKPVEILLGLVTAGNVGKYNLEVTRSSITTTKYSFRQLVSDVDSYLSISESIIVDGLDLDGGSQSWKGQADMSDSTFYIEQDRNLTPRAAWSSISNCVFDGTPYLEINGSILSANNLVCKVANGNSAINLNTTLTNTPDTNSWDANGKQSAFNPVGAVMNYSRAVGSSSYVPTWPVGTPYLGIGDSFLTVVGGSVVVSNTRPV